MPLKHDHGESGKTKMEKTPGNEIEIERRFNRKTGRISVCVGCGHEEPEKVGCPAGKTKCPKCGAIMLDKSEIPDPLEEESSHISHGSK